MKHTLDLMVCYAPTVNSYKRYQSQSWAPTSIAWSTDNRTAGFRIVGSGSGLRIECRIPGADVNPYLAYAAALASGLDGIANKIEPPAEFQGDAYNSTDVPHVPTTLAEALERFRDSAEARRLLGDAVVDHYSHFLTMECDAYEASVTDWERRRYFERI
jgi:glutamine synthetase